MFFKTILLFPCVYVPEEVTSGAGVTDCCAPALGGANDAEDCCLSVTQRPIPGNIVKAFRYLLIKDGCRVPAVVFTTLRGYQLCAPPDQPWVERIIRRLKKSSAKSNRNRS
ncbi:C-C motif chemokine 19 isoform X1 [Mesocricetus auratus]|uniref:C-C motif chemokine n=1 Tax=Mesocricetus auratus TaxID=10036 RepID=A0ABM2WYC4_MESAU|nr:C-C motif chemokine 19 isoform X1 [Mesocricetus auratus]